MNETMKEEGRKMEQEIMELETMEQAMQYTEYLCEMDLVRAEAERLLLDNPDIESTMLGVIQERLALDARSYLDYGPYWPALRQVLGMDGELDAAVAQVYCGGNAIETMLMADDFRTMNLGSNPRYTGQFMLDGENGIYWTLFDQEMEAALEIIQK